MRKIIRKRVPCVWLLTTAAAIVPITLPAQSQSDKAATPTTETRAMKSDSKAAGFLKDAARDNDLEISLAEIGARQAQNQDLKMFCQHLQQDHTQLASQMKPLAQQYGVTIDQSLSRKGTREETKLEKLSGAQFDQKLAVDLLQEHRKAINLFEKTLQQNPPADIQQFAQSTLPKLQRHFDEAQTVAKTVGVDQSTISSIAKKTNESVGGASDEFRSGTGTGSDQKTERGEGAKELHQDNPPPQQQ